MSRLIVIEGHEGQRRQLAEQLAALSEKNIFFYLNFRFIYDNLPLFIKHI